MERTLRERIANMAIVTSFMILLLANIVVGTMLYVVLTSQATPAATNVPATQEQIEKTPDEMSLEVL